MLSCYARYGRAIHQCLFDDPTFLFSRPVPTPNGRCVLTVCICGCVYLRGSVHSLSKWTRSKSCHLVSRGCVCDYVQTAKTRRLRKRREKESSSRRRPARRRSEARQKIILNLISRNYPAIRVPFMIRAILKAVLTN